jgi:hypothetical protein
MRILCFRLVATFYLHLHPMLRWWFWKANVLSGSLTALIFNRFVHQISIFSYQLSLRAGHFKRWCSNGVSWSNIWSILQLPHNAKQQRYMSPTCFAFQSFSTAGYCLLVMCFQSMLAGFRFSTGSTFRTEPNRFTWT